MNKRRRRRQQQEEVKDILHIFITFLIARGRYQFVCALNDGIISSSLPFLFTLSHSLSNQILTHGWINSDDLCNNFLFASAIEPESFCVFVVKRRFHGSEREREEFEWSLKWKLINNRRESILLYNEWPKGVFMNEQITLSRLTLVDLNPKTVKSADHTHWHVMKWFEWQRGGKSETS